LTQEDALAVLALAKARAQTVKQPVELTDSLIKELAYTAAGNLPAICSVIGGIVAQEVLKAVSGKFGPIHQFLFFDATEIIPPNLTEADVQPVRRRAHGCGVARVPAPALRSRCPLASACGVWRQVNSRYDAQIKVIGRALQEKVQDQRQFLVGAGAIGCEMLKNWALMGLGTRNGHITVTDMDTIEQSNLNRQFLFRPNDIGVRRIKGAYVGMPRPDR